MFKKILKTLFFSIVILLISLPYAAKFGAIHYLETEKNIEANIDDLRFNLFTGKVGLSGVHLYGENTGELHLGELLIDIKMLALLEKKILIESIIFQDFSSNITELENAWNVGGIHIPLSETEETKPEEPTESERTFDWGYGINTIAFSNIKINVASQYTDSKIVLNKLAINDISSWHPENASELELDLAINGKRLHITGDATPLTNEPLINTRIHIVDIQLKPFLKSLKDLPFESIDAALFSDFQLTLNVKNDGMQIAVNGNVGLKDINLKDSEREIKLAKITINAEKKITLGENMKLSGIASLTMDQLDISSQDGKVQIASFEQWITQKIKLNSLEDIRVGLSELNNVTFLKENKTKTPTLAIFDKLIISDITYQPNLVNIKSIELLHLLADIELNEQGEIPALALISSEKKTEKAPTTNDASETPPQSESKPFGFTLGKLVITPDSQIRFVDNSVTPVFDTKLHKLSLNITQIDTIDPEQAADIDFHVNIDEYAKFLIKGNVRPFGEKLNATLIAKIEALELVPLSSYAGKFAGMNIKRGVLDLDANIKIKNDILNIKNTFYLNQLNIESDETETSNNIFKDMPMPLDLTLDVLRDKNNVIKLDIPIEGDVNKPDFKLQDVYNKAMAKAVKFAATHYLLQAVQPLGLAITAGKLIGKAMVPKFDPLIFDPGSSEISSTNQKHIKKLAKILQDKEKLKFTVCGNATETDWKEINVKEASDTNNDAEKTAPPRTKRLLKLANERTKVVKKYFVEKYKIAPKRLLACNGKISKDEEEKVAIPAVEITL